MTIGSVPPWAFTLALFLTPLALVGLMALLATRFRVDRVLAWGDHQRLCYCWTRREAVRIAHQEERRTGGQYRIWDRRRQQYVVY